MAQEDAPPESPLRDGKTFTDTHVGSNDVERNDMSSRQELEDYPVERVEQVYR